MMLVIVVVCAGGGDDGWLCRLLLVGEVKVKQIYDVNWLHCMSKVKEQAVITELYIYIYIYQPHTCVYMYTCYTGFISGFRSRGGKHIVTNFEGGGTKAPP